MIVSRLCTSAASRPPTSTGCRIHPAPRGDLGHLNAFFLLIDKPEVYNLPSAPTRASNRVVRAC